MRRLLKVIVLVVGLQACALTDNAISLADTEALLPIAESLIDDFYSFDSVRLEEALASAEESKESLLYYQGWAEGGNYQIVERKHCAVKSSNIVSCPITVRDDPMLALGVDFFVTDTFEIGFEDARVSSVETSSNDLPIYYEARDWASAMAEGYRRFAASDDFPNP